MSEDETPQGPRPLPVLAVRRARGQSWCAEDEVERAGYIGMVGEIVRVPDLLGGLVYYELAALVPPHKAGIVSTNELVWWLLPVRAEMTDSDMETVSEERKSA